MPGKEKSNGQVIEAWTQQARYPPHENPKGRKKTERLKINTSFIMSELNRMFLDFFSAF